MSDTQLACPECRGVAVVQTGDGCECRACGESFDREGGDLVPVDRSGVRGDTPAGTLEQMDPSEVP